MIKIPGVDLEKIKKMGSDLVDSVKSGEVINKVKSSVDSFTQGSRSNVILPEEIQQRLTEIQILLDQWREAKAAEQKLADHAYQAVFQFSQEVRTLCEKSLGSEVVVKEEIEPEIKKEEH